MHVQNKIWTQGNVGFSPKVQMMNLPDHLALVDSTALLRAWSVNAGTQVLCLSLLSHHRWGHLILSLRNWKVEFTTPPPRILHTFTMYTRHYYARWWFGIIDRPTVCLSHLYRPKACDPMKFVIELFNFRRQYDNDKSKTHLPAMRHSTVTSNLRFAAWPYELWTAWATGLKNTLTVISCR